MITGSAFARLRAAATGARLLVLCAVVLAPLAAQSQQPSIPRPTGLVNDFAGVLDPAAAARITRIAEDVRMKSRGEIAVVTLPDLEGRDVADVALRIGREWRVGKIGDPGDPTRNAGAVILLVPRETNSDGSGRCFILTGQGAEGFITDGTAGTICREATPAFVAREYATGLELVTLRTAERFASEFGFTLDTALIPQQPVSRQRPGRSGGISPLLLLIIFFVVMSMMNNAGRRGRRRGRRDGCGGGMPLIIPFPMGGGGWHSRGGGFGGGGFGGGFGGFGGGGGFSGGGGGSAW
jgi:uncharacterized protein